MEFLGGKAFAYSDHLRGMPFAALSATDLRLRGIKSPMLRLVGGIG